MAAVELERVFQIIQPLDHHLLDLGRAPYRLVNLYLPPQAGVGLAARIRFGD